MDIVAVVLSLFVAFLWASNTVIQKYGMNQSINQKTVLVIGTTIYFICMVFFTIYSYDIIKKDINKENAKTIALIAVGSIFGTFVATILFLNLLEKHKSSLVTTLTYTTPLFVLLLALLFLKEKVTDIQILGIFVTVIGIMILCYELSPS